MPVLEHIKAMAETPTPAGNSPAPADENAPPQAVRELTQTDHLNRRLLKSLLENMQATEVLAQENGNGSNEEDNDFEE
ncbi:uncharacterized protein LOC6608243 [Drosophila sechellia]|uniref:GD10609 n=2 Tax=melanogaster subgroup TaxID=32351 RepID=B4QGA0_DROSI|nr:uncharacterized protein LOC6608243 [Drosophila sechellia]XP_002080665.1 uncharacterized protein LOC6733611 [Drosophila simulans]EDW47000.1 GM21073 [Drosophila sechellia]EDX06250.1 GD10609 [Drosophila simulans]KMY92362.1 uncharacterized protein Dsimw501_GD10609 [Drosophila simulans]